MHLKEPEIEQLKNELTFTAVRSSGAGGQHVNKVNTKVELRFDILNSRVLDENQKNLLLKKLKNKINSEGELILSSQRERSQFKNKHHVTNRFVELIVQTLQPVKKRKRTKPTITSKIKRLQNKRLRSEKKLLRKRPTL